MRIDRAFLEELVRNYNLGVPGRIPVPLTHTDDPSKNAGELVELSIEGDGTSLEDGLYGVLEIRRDDVADDIRNELIFDVSISFTDHYQDKESGANHGAVLLHVALVNNPYIKKMGSFKGLAEDLKQIFGAKTQVRALSETANQLKERSMSTVQNDRDFPVTVTFKDGDEETTAEVKPGEELKVNEDQVEAVKQQLSEAEAPKKEEEAPAGEEASGEPDEPADEQSGEDDSEDEGTELSESATLKKELRETQKLLRDKEIEEQYQTALSEGKVVPAQEDAFKGLAQALHGQTRSLSDGETQNLSELLAEFVAKTPKIVSLDDERGKTEEDAKDPMAKLPEETKQGLDKAGVSREDYAKYGARESVSINELASKEK
jgi:hypothetical protein